MDIITFNSSYLRMFNECIMMPFLFRFLHKHILNGNRNCVFKEGKVVTMHLVYLLINYKWRHFLFQQKNKIEYFNGSAFLQYFLPLYHISKGQLFWHVHYKIRMQVNKLVLKSWVQVVSSWLRTGIWETTKCFLCRSRQMPGWFLPVICL